MCVSDATTRLCEFWTSGNFNSASIWLIGIGRQDVFYNCHGKWDAYWIGMDFGWFGCVCCSAAWELLRTGSTCPCQNMHRDSIPCNSLLGQKGVEKSCWLEKWMLSMAFHNAVWLISMVKIQELFPSCTGMTKATTWQTEWAVMAVNYVQSHWSCWIVLSSPFQSDQMGLCTPFCSIKWVPTTKWVCTPQLLVSTKWLHTPPDVLMLNVLLEWVCNPFCKNGSIGIVMYVARDGHLQNGCWKLSRSTNS